MASTVVSRTVLHDCGCYVVYATDRHGEYPLSVEGCALNEELVAQLQEGSISDAEFLLNIKAHRAGKEA